MANLLHYFIPLILLNTGFIVCLDYFNANTPVGNFLGVVENVQFNGDLMNVTRFLGIPYAKPPEGERRFARPEPYGDIKSTYNATYFRAHCPQSEVVNKFIKYFQMSEDCLHLNIYIPGNSLSPANTYPVMVFIHGGSFTFGGAEVFSGDTLSAFHNVIVVTVNYRLNTFGFLSNGTRSSGNFGLWDQKLAIEWVHENIGGFGGNPAEVTLFGNSAGAVCVLYQSLNLENRGLFKRIIAQSGSVLAQWAQEYHPQELFEEFVEEVGCTSPNYEKIVECLRSKTTEELITYRFSPVIDGDFIKEDPVKKWVQFNTETNIESIKFFSELDYLSGVTSKDGAMVVVKYGDTLKSMNLDIASGVPRKFFEETFIPNMLMQIYGGNLTEMMIQSAIHQYTSWSDPNNPLLTRENMVDFATDTTFAVPAINIATLHAQNSVNSTFFYVFDHKPLYVRDPEWLTGAKHTMELPYVFGLSEAMKIAAGFPPGTPVQLPPDEIALTTNVMTMWTNYAKSGNPSLPVKLPRLPQWPEYDNYNQSYLQLDVSMTLQSVKHHPVASRVAFWNTVAPLLENCVSCGQPDKCVQKPTSSAWKIGSSAFLCLLIFLL